MTRGRPANTADTVLSESERNRLIRLLQSGEIPADHLRKRYKIGRRQLAELKKLADEGGRIGPVASTGGSDV